MNTAAGLAQSVERLTAEREGADSIPGAGPDLKIPQKESTAFALQMARPSSFSDDQI